MLSNIFWSSYTWWKSHLSHYLFCTSVPLEDKFFKIAIKVSLSTRPVHLYFPFISKFIMKIATFLVLLIVIVAASGNSWIVRVLIYFFPFKLQQLKLPRGLQQPPKGRSQQPKPLRELQQPPESQSQPLERPQQQLNEQTARQPFNFPLHFLWQCHFL